MSHNFKYEVVFEAVLGIFDNVKQKRNFLYEVYFIKQSVSEIVLLLFKVRIQLELIFKFILIPQKKFPHFVLVYDKAQCIRKTYGSCKHRGGFFQ